MKLRQRSARAVIVGVSALGACVGDSTTPTNDAGADATTPDGSTDSSAIDAADAAPACNLAESFGAPAVLANLYVGDKNSARLSHDELTIYFETSPKSTDGGSVGADDIATATRTSLVSPWGPVTFLAIDTTSNETDPSPNQDNLTLYFASDRVGTVGQFDLWTATRAMAVSAFANVANVSSLNTTHSEFNVYVLPGELTLYYASNASGTNDLMRATRTSTSAFSVDGSGAFAAVNTASVEQYPVATIDDLTIYFTSDRAGGVGQTDIWKASRSSTSDPFGSVTNVTELNSTFADSPTWISDDGCRIYLTSSRNVSSTDIYVASKPAL